MWSSIYQNVGIFLSIAGVMHCVMGLIAYRNIVQQIVQRKVLAAVHIDEPGNLAFV
jgi:hypothetical protein